MGKSCYLRLLFFDFVVETCRRYDSRFEILRTLRCAEVVCFWLSEPSGGGS